MITKWHADIGHWLQWQFEVPEEGDYTLWARYATDCALSRRSLTLDGASPGAAYDDIGFQATGGYCTAADNWRLLKLGPPVHLASGRHTVRMTNLADGLALDYLAVVKAQQ